MPADSLISRVVSRVCSPTVREQRIIAVVNVIAQIGVALGGSVVRVTESGLGCPTWPDCAGSSLVPIADPVNGQLHQWIEFGNRMLGGLVGVVGVVVFLVTLVAKPRRMRYILLGLAMPMGIVLQAVLGGITVRMKLDWWTVCLHFLPSPLLVWVAVLLLRAVNEGDEPARPLVPRPLRGLLALMTAVLTGLITAGTLVTAAGPHAGDIHTPRLGLPIVDLAQFHSDFLFVFLGMLAGFGLALRITGGTPASWRRFWILTGVVLAQGTLGFTQYELGVPDTLVALHVLGAMLTVAAMAGLWCATRERGPLPSPAVTPQQTEPAVG